MSKLQEIKRFVTGSKELGYSSVVCDIESVTWLIEQLEQAQAANQKLVECLEGMHELLCQAAAMNTSVDDSNLANWIESTLSEVKGNVSSTHT